MAVPRCQILPEANHQAVFLVDGREVTRWHFGPDYPRPFFYPIMGPSGQSLTRMGHPGAPNHDHHRSVWFAHHDVDGVNFWSDHTEARIRQKRWLVYQDGEHEAVMATELAWEAGHDRDELLTQELVASIQAQPRREWVLEMQSTFSPRAERLVFGKTNFGFLAVRMAKHLSEFFGGGTLLNSEGFTRERELFGKRAKWVDYAGPKPGGGEEGITYFDHPDNPGYPNAWHVREDGWMGCSPCMNGPLVITRDKPLVLRHLLVMHDGRIAAGDAPSRHERVFAKAPIFRVNKSDKRHRQFEVTPRRFD